MSSAFKFNDASATMAGTRRWMGRRHICWDCRGVAMVCVGLHGKIRCVGLIEVGPALKCCVMYIRCVVFVDGQWDAGMCRIFLYGSDG
jgi:hypothetical protein